MPGDAGHGTDGSEQRTDSDDADAAQSARRRHGRRRFLTASGGLTAALLAGCSGIVPGGGSPAGGNTSTADGAASATSTDTPGTPSPETDVVGLQYKQDGSNYTFIVTLNPPGETAGADWWQVETLGGEQIARKEFDEPSGSERFTTSKSISVGDGTTAVVVRGHDADTGYGGQVMLANLEEGFIALEKQGDEPSSFENYSF